MAQGISAQANNRAHQRAEERRREGEARQQRLAHSQVFQPTTRRCLEQVAVVGEQELAEHLAESIRHERGRSGVSAERRSRS